MSRFMAGSWRMVLRALSSMATCVVCIEGCAQWGGQVLEDNHVAFNTSVAQAMDRQMLLNIVRLSMDKPTQWLMVSGINVGTSVSAGAGGDITVPTSGLVSGSAAGDLNFSYTPNIQFVPRQGEQLARELMSPIPVQSVESMVSASWPISWTLFLTCERFQDVNSFDVTKGFGVHLIDPKFGRLMELFDSLQSQQLVSMSLVPLPVHWNIKSIPPAEVTLERILAAKKERGLYFELQDGNYDYLSIEQASVLNMYEGIQQNPDGVEFMKLANLGDKPGTFRLITMESAAPGARVSIRTRSLSALLQLISRGVDKVKDAPQLDFDLDSPSEMWMHLSKADKTTNLGNNVGAVFRVHRSDHKPANASVSVRFMGEWFWIDDNDQTSKRIFSLVRDLFDLQVKSGAEQGPVLTLPVGR